MRKKPLNEEIAEVVRLIRNDKKKGRHKRGDQKRKKK